MKANIYRVFVVGVSVLCVSTLGVALVSASTTISTDIETDGILSVTGTSTLLGTVAIGTTTTTHTDGAVGGLLIVGDLVSDRTLEIHNNYAEGIDVYTHSNTATFRAPFINLYRSRGTQSAPTPPNSGDTLGGLQFGAYDGSNYNIQASIQSSAEENFSTTNTPANLMFYTNPSGSSNADNQVERMRITGSGNVGIGTVAPTASLQVATSTSNATTTVEIGKTGQNKGSCLALYDVTGAAVYVTVQSGSLVVSSASCK